MNNRIPGIESKLQEKPQSKGVKIAKWIALCLVLALAAATVAASVLYTRYVSVEEGVWLIDLTGTDAGNEEAERLKELFPEAQIRLSVDIGGTSVDNDITRLVATKGQDISIDRLIEEAGWLTRLGMIDLTGVEVSFEQYDRLREAYPEAEIKWIVPVAAFGGLSPNTSAVRPADMGALREVVAALAYLPEMKSISMADAQLSEADLAEVKVIAGQLSGRGIELAWGIRAAGQNFEHTTTEVRLSGNYGAADLAELSRLPALESLTLDSIQTGDLSPLTSITTLESLTVCNMRVDDIMVLAGMDWLGAFYVKNTNVSWEELYELQRELPECIVMILE